MISGSGNAGSESDQVRQARVLVDDLFERRPAIYWLDFGVTVTLTWALVAVYFTAPAWSPLQLGAMFVAAVGVFRAGTFMHEIVHFKSGELVAFKWVWNLLLGFPMLAPWVLYRNHIEHHSRRHFGTRDDAEYLPLAAMPPIETFRYLSQALVLPALAAIRFGILGPLSRLSRPLREWLLTTASAAATNPYYRKRFPARSEPELARSEWFCFAWLAILVAMTVFGPMRPVHWLMAWALVSLAYGLNWLRNLAAHGYANDGDPHSHIEQLDDSINLTGQTWLTAWLFPVGLRYHALHHLLPGLPYHQLGGAHRRLIDGLPDDHPYHASNHSSYFTIVGRLLRGAWASRGQRKIARYWQTGH